MANIVLGLDIGGANLKAASSAKQAVLRPFELWRRPQELTAALIDLMLGFPTPIAIAVTMTGELCDCFASRRAGVEAILGSVASAAQEIPVFVWTHDGVFRSIAASQDNPLKCAAANWLALATYATRFVSSKSAILLDIGSTTTDVVPLEYGRPVPKARADLDRLRSKELIYTGVRRTPLCVLLGDDGAAELFATTQDAYLVLGRLPEEPEIRQTADGRPATVAAARQRLAHMLCADRETCADEVTNRLVEEIWRRQVALIRAGVDLVIDGMSQPPVEVLIAGSGEFLAQDVLSLEPSLPYAQISLAKHLGTTVSEAACAYAVAMLAAERIQ
jgi:probable H4MPT-linked C1 transfer pathway protein